MNEEIVELLRDRFAQRSNAAYISLPVIFSVLSSIQGNVHLLKLGLYLFLLAFISLNSIYILIAQKSRPGILDRNGNRIEILVPKYPTLHILAKAGLVVSVIMLISGFFIPEFRGIASSLSTETPTATVTSVSISETPTATLSPTSTQTISSTTTPTLTSTPTFTPTATATPTPTINPMVFRGLDQQCLSQSLWEPSYYQGESKEVDSRNCWNLTGWGITPENKGLSIIVNDSDLGQDITRRFYTIIKGDAEIKFTVRIDQFTTKPNFDGILMMGVGSSSTITKSGYYIKYAFVESKNKIFRDIGPGLKIYYEPRSEYMLGESQNIIIRIVGSQAKILADGVLLRTMTLSEEERSVFWVIYSLPSNNGSLIAEISDFQIYDHR